MGFFFSEKKSEFKGAPQKITKFFQMLGFLVRQNNEHLFENALSQLVDQPIIFFFTPAVHRNG